jgi:AcrR family transcriptional regulator
VNKTNARSKANGQRAAQETSTRDAILNVAEDQFAAAGYDGASVRDIQRAANANGGAVFYYFGTKQALYEAVFERLVEPLLQERMRRLLLCANPADAAPRLEDILAAYIEPSLRDGFENPRRRRNFAHIQTQLLQSHHSFMRDMLARHFTRAGASFLAALARALPDLAPRDLQWRHHTMVGALAFAMAGTERLRLGEITETALVYDPADTQEALSQMIGLMTAVFRAPPAITCERV